MSRDRASRKRVQIHLGGFKQIMLVAFKSLVGGLKGIRDTLVLHPCPLIPVVSEGSLSHAPSGN